MTNILLAGVGGQGTVLASKLLARAAMDAGLNVRTAETIGMAQRGGCVVSHVRIGNCYSSLIPLGAADFIIGFEPGEAVRCLPYLKNGGAVVAATGGVMPVTASLGSCDYSPEAMLDYLRRTVPNLTLLDGSEVCAQCGSSKVLNVALLGAFATAYEQLSTAPEITFAGIENAVREMVPERFIEMNLAALKLGAGVVTAK
ncbi:MAG: pyruvate ferredoxin oxidoreductase [Ruminococcaceae bacterium]|nr:pyruvate ferredoxin oxidoreductase [Oscillospiraceae bacterium]